MRILLTLLIALLVGVTSAPAQQGQHLIVTSEALKWVDPPTFPGRSSPDLAAGRLAESAGRIPGMRHFTEARAIDLVARALPPLVLRSPNRALTRADPSNLTSMVTGRAYGSRGQQTARWP